MFTLLLSGLGAVGGIGLLSMGLANWFYLVTEKKTADGDIKQLTINPTSEQNIFGIKPFKFLGALCSAFFVWVVVKFFVWGKK